MFIYNVTIKVDWSIHEDWLVWMREEQIPGMLAGDHFFKYQMVRLLEIDEDEGPTYAIQYYAKSKEDYLQFLHTTASVLSENAIKKWGRNLFFSERLWKLLTNCG